MKQSTQMEKTVADSGKAPSADLPLDCFGRVIRGPLYRQHIEREKAATEERERWLAIYKAKRALLD